MFSLFVFSVNAQNIPDLNKLKNNINTINDFELKEYWEQARGKDIR